MRRLTVLVLALTALLSLAACGKDRGMEVRPSEFSEETRKVLSILDGELAFFDYETDNTIRSMTVTLWSFEEGAWESVAFLADAIEVGEAQVAVRMGENTFDFYNLSEDGYTRRSWEGTRSDFDGIEFVGNQRLPGPTAIVPGEEIALWVRLGMEGNSIRAGDMEDFRSADCAAGLAVTVTFSEAELE